MSSGAEMLSSMVDNAMEVKWLIERSSVAEVLIEAAIEPSIERVHHPAADFYFPMPKYFLEGMTYFGGEATY